MSETTGHVPAAELSDNDRQVLTDNWNAGSAELDQILALNRSHRSGGGCADWFCCGPEMSDQLDSYSWHQLQIILRVAVERLTGRDE